MNTPVIYTANLVVDAETAFSELWNELDWQRRGDTPRQEYYCNVYNTPYTYGRGAGVRTYEAQPIHPRIQSIWDLVEKATGTKFDACFLNGYRDGKDHLGWHADDSPEMDDDRSIGIVSLGQKRKIYFRPNGTQDPALVEELWLESGSLAEMKPGMQDTHQHRIPKAGFTPCSARVSLTFRGLV